MSSRRGGFATSSASRKQPAMSPCGRADTGLERKPDKASFSQGGATVTALKSRLAPCIQTAVSTAVDTLLAEVALVLDEAQRELQHKEQENERLKVRLQVSERELKNLQECLCSAQKLIDQLQVPYSAAQSVFAPPPLTSMAPMTSGLDRDQQSTRSVNGVDLGLGGSVDDNLHEFEPRDDFKICQLSIQPDGSVTGHSLDSYGSDASHLCSDSGRADDRPVRFAIKEEQGLTAQPRTKDEDGRDGEGVLLTMGDIGYGQVGGNHLLRHQRLTRECDGGLQQVRNDEQLKVRTSGVDRESPGRVEEPAGPSETTAEPSADRPHHCLECGKTFRLISSLKKHIRIHTGEKPYPCGVCGRRFRESGALKTHLRIHTGEKPYSCSECGNCFRHLDGLRKHRRTHTGEKPYVCSICGKRLSRLQHLKHHQLIHTGERPCCCPFCDRTFKEPAALRKHVRTHRDEGGAMGPGPSDDTDPDTLDNINSLHPAAPSPQMRFEEWGPVEEDGPVVDCV